MTIALTFKGSIDLSRPVQNWPTVKNMADDGYYGKYNYYGKKRVLRLEERMEERSKWIVQQVPDLGQLSQFQPTIIPIISDRFGAVLCV